MEIDKEKLIKFCSEIYMLKRNKREGWYLSGVNSPDSLADHITLAAQLAYIIGEFEGLDGAKCAMMVLFHDNGEARITDQHKVAARYIDKTKAEKQAFVEQMELLPKKIRDKIITLFNEYEDAATPESVVAKDADWLEAALQAKIHCERGYDLGIWIDNVSKALRTKSAKMILDEIKKMDKFTTIWWQGLKKLNHNEIYH